MQERILRYERRWRNIWHLLTFLYGGRNAVAQIEIGCGIGGVDRYKFDVHGLKLFDLPVE